MVVLEEEDFGVAPLLFVLRCFGVVVVVVEDGAPAPPSFGFKGDDASLSLILLIVSILSGIIIILSEGNKTSSKRSLQSQSQVLCNGF